MIGGLLTLRDVYLMFIHFKYFQYTEMNIVWFFRYIYPVWEVTQWSFFAFADNYGKLFLLSKGFKVYKYCYTFGIFRRYGIQICTSPSFFFS